MFERFSEPARRVLFFARYEASQLGSARIDTEHLLLGLLAEGEGVGAQALQVAGITLDAARAKVAEMVGCGLETPSGRIPFAPRAKKVLELALRESLRLNHHYIGTEHILLGLLREGRAPACRSSPPQGCGPTNSATACLS